LEATETEPRVVPELLEIMEGYLDTGVFGSTSLPESSLSASGDYFFSSAAFCFLNFSAILKSAKFFG
jgi:hypothetical protein